MTNQHALERTCTYRCLSWILHDVSTTKARNKGEILTCHVADKEKAFIKLPLKNNVTFLYITRGRVSSVHHTGAKQPLMRNSHHDLHVVCTYSVSCDLYMVHVTRLCNLSSYVSVLCVAAAIKIWWVRNAVESLVKRWGTYFVDGKRLSRRLSGHLSLLQPWRDDSYHGIIRQWQDNSTWSTDRMKK